MKRLLLISMATFAVSIALAGDGSKTWSQQEADYGSFKLYFIQDKETGTRCYSLVSESMDGGSAISCIPKGASK